MDDAFRWQAIDLFDRRVGDKNQTNKLFIENGGDFGSADAMGAGKAAADQGAAIAQKGFGHAIAFDVDEFVGHVAGARGNGLKR